MPKVKDPSFRFIDLFAGVGGIRLGFEAAGGECVFSSEWDPFAQKTYAANFGHAPHGDITKIAASAIPAFDVLAAGFPCQPFSSIGRREGFDHPTQGTLFHDVVRIIKHHRPKAFLLENVAGLTTHDGGRTMEVIEKSLLDLGYDVWHRVLDAAGFGVPQHRKRIYIVGLRVENARRKPQLFADSGGDETLWSDKQEARRFEFPKPSPKHIGIGQFLESGVTGHGISKHLQDVYLRKLNDGRPELVDAKSDFPVKTLVASYHKIQRLTGTFVLDGDTGIRLLTASECKAIMGFPAAFEIPVSRTQMYRQMGNSVAVPVVKAIARNIAAAIDRPAREARRSLKAGAG
jgi:DNA (cytosine-5)-methyltransferase 1